MSGHALPWLVLTTGLLVGQLLAVPLAAASRPTVAQALELKPVQPDVDFDSPTPEQIEKCSIRSELGDSVSGWVVQGEHGQTLRRFLDTNQDNKVDLWCYFKGGMEVYRDIDVDYDGKADQYRWLSIAGMRWGLDPNEDGLIDTWKMISPEEVTAEVVAALRNRDASRFQRLLPTPEELDALALGAKHRKEFETRIAAARTGFSDMATSQKLVASTSQWLQFGATRPGILPAGTDGSTKDLLVYDNVAAIFETDGKHGQLIVGTLVNVGAGWRVVDLPKSEPAEGFFVPPAMRSQEPETTVEGGLDESLRKLLAELEKIDQAMLASREPSSRAKLHAQRADLLERLADEAKSSEDRGSWIRQFADTVSAAVQTGEFPDGVGRLKALVDKLAGEPNSNELAACVRFRYLTADYGEKLQQPNADFTQVHAQWLNDLEKFVTTYPRSEETAEAMLQLAVAQEFAGKDDEAVKWYSRMIEDFAGTQPAAKAAGAKRRLESVGKSIELQGKTLTGAPLDLGRFRGNVVLIHYWATWCEPCKRDLQTLKALQAKFAGRGFALVGVSLDSDLRPLQEFVKSERLAWPQLFEPGGLDSRFANELGILTLPTMILIDKTGRVVRRNVHASELEEELAKLLK